MSVLAVVTLLWDEIFSLMQKNVLASKPGKFARTPANINGFG
jgi:hypothetical protein